MDFASPLPIALRHCDIIMKDGVMCIEPFRRDGLGSLVLAGEEGWKVPFWEKQYPWGSVSSDDMTYGRWVS